MAAATTPNSIPIPMTKYLNITRTYCEMMLKQEPGKNILVGGVDVPSQLMELGLIDEYRLVVSPVIVGEGRRLFEGVNLPEKRRLKLVESKTFKSGSVALRYSKQ